MHNQIKSHNCDENIKIPQIILTDNQSKRQTNFRLLKQQVNMTKKYPNQRPQNNLWHQKDTKTQRNETKTYTLNINTRAQNNQLSLPQQYDRQAGMDTKTCIKQYHPHVMA